MNNPATALVRAQSHLGVAGQFRTLKAYKEMAEEIEFSARLCRHVMRDTAMMHEQLIDNFASGADCKTTYFEIGEVRVLLYKAQSLFSDILYFAKEWDKTEGGYSCARTNNLWLADRVRKVLNEPR